MDHTLHVDTHSVHYTYAIGWQCHQGMIVWNLQHTCWVLLHMVAHAVSSDARDPIDEQPLGLHCMLTISDAGWGLGMV